MKKNNILLLFIFSFLIFSGCTQNIQEANKLELNETKTLVDNTTNLDINLNGSSITLNKSNVDINYKNTTISAENVSITVDNTGVYEVNLSVKNNLTLSNEIPIEKWCIKGKTFEVKNQSNVNSSSIIIGIEEYKGKIYCKAESETMIYSMKVLTTYYFNYGATDIWAKVNTNGVINEIHINNK